MGTWSATATLQKRLEVLRNIENTYPMTLQLQSWAFTPEKEKLLPHKNLYTILHNSFTCNCQKLETTKTSLSGWLAKHTTMYPDPGWLTQQKKVWTSDTRDSLYGSHGHEVERKTPISKGKVCMILLICPFQHDKIIRMENIGGGQELRMEVQPKKFWLVRWFCILISVMFLWIYHYSKIKVL